MSSGQSMERETTRFPPGQLDALETLVEDGWFDTRSEAIRAATRTLLAEYDDRSELGGDPDGG